MSKIIVSGSTAYDNIMSSNSNFKDHLIEKEVWNIDISYLVSDLKEELWWTWANISYNLALLWSDSVLLSSIWTDYNFSDFMRNNVDLSNINISKDKLTARSYISKDSKYNKITSFYPWAMEDSCDIYFKNPKDSKYWVVWANHVDIMKKHLKMFKQNWINSLFVPGQQIVQLNREELLELIDLSDYIILNEYEYELIKKISWLSDWEMIDSFEKMILTYWIKWSKIFDRTYNILEIYWVENPEALDSTWAWNAYIAWILHWLNNWYNWETSAKIWAVLASLATWSFWAQNHKTTWDKFKTLYKETFWDIL